MKNVLLSVAALPLAVSATLADALVYEGFDYVDDGTTLLGTTTLNGGTGFSGAWVTTDTVAGSDAYYQIDDSAVTPWGSLSQTGSALRRQQTGGIESLSRAINVGDGTGGTVDLDAQDELWFSLLVGTRGTTQFAIGSGGFADGGGGNGAMGGTGDGFGISMTGNQDGTVSAARWTAGGGRSRGNTVNLGDTTQFFAGQIIWGTGGGNDVLNLYVVGEDLQIDTSTISSTVSGNVDETQLSVVTLSTNRGPTLDEIRIGYTAADVGITIVPEPSTYAMLAGLLAMSSLMIRRRQ